MQRKAKGFFEQDTDELYYTIDNLYEMEDFFLTIPSSSDIWTFLWSQGGISSGRGNSDKAIFPYYTDDKISDMKYSTGSLSMIKSEDTCWKVFDPAKRNPCSISMPRNLSNIRFSEKNEELGLSFTLTWHTSEKYGLVKEIRIKAERDASFTLLDGARNLMPACATSDFQNTNSTLLDAYKKTELDELCSLVSLSLSSVITDRAEPNEALETNITYFTAEGKISLDADAEKSFIDDTISFATSSLGERGSAFIVKDISLKKDEEYTHLQVFDVSYSSKKYSDFRTKLSTIKREKLEEMIREDIILSSNKLTRLIKEADGIEETGDLMADVHHEANVLFNIMRGGTFISQEISIPDFKDFLEKRNKAIAKSFPYPNKESVDYLSLKELAEQDAQTKRLFYEYIPLTFSRRHGDPSRPWNRFDIKVTNEKGEAILNYEGNWRDIFQNWEALSLSYPTFLEHMISRFLDTMSVDGYNPYKINRDGFDWEEPDPNNPWAQIGYWNDHQVIYLVRLLELLRKYDSSSLFKDISAPRFSTANVPYRLKSYKEIEKNPHSTILFDKELNIRIKRIANEKGSDGKLILTSDGDVELVSFSTKILQIIVSKTANLVPDGGIWMNTQRPEWNDANNALAGFGLSVVSLAALRQLIKLYIEVLEKNSAHKVWISKPVKEAFDKIVENFKSNTDRLKTLRANGEVFEKERNYLYQNGFSAQTAVEEKHCLIKSLNAVLSIVDESLKANKRDDGLYHSYNVLEIKDDDIIIHPMKLQLEGQVAVLSSGLVDAKGAVEIMQALSKSPLHEEITGAYLLYPDRILPKFWEKNNITEVDESRKGIKAGDGSNVLEEDKRGVWHFKSSIRNKTCLDTEVGRENIEIENLYEKTFNHRFFTGRSDSFFRYEGLGSIYWHMVSKLLLSLGEIIVKTEKEEEREALIAEYRKLRSSLGYKRSASSYGSFPFIPYSHTPKGKGAKQPGMTGQVKEDIISRNIELGANVENGCFQINPVMLEKSEFKADGSLSYSRFNTQIKYKLYNGDNILIALNDGEYEKKNTLTRKESESLFLRSGEINVINVLIPESILK